MKILAGLVTPKASPFGLQTTHPSCCVLAWPFFCAQIPGGFFSYKNVSPVGLGLYPYDLTEPNYLLKDHISKYSHNLGLVLEYTDFGGGRYGGGTTQSVMFRNK